MHIKPDFFYHNFGTPTPPPQKKTTNRHYSLLLSGLR